MGRGRLQFYFKDFEIYKGPNLEIKCVVLHNQEDSRGLPHILKNRMELHVSVKFPLN